jgi:hypothetical protein
MKNPVPRELREALETSTESSREERNTSIMDNLWLGAIEQPASRKAARK